MSTLPIHRVPSGSLTARLALVMGLCIFPLMAHSADERGGSGSTPQSDDFRETPYTRYGEFDQSDREADAALFFQYGRFFGVSLGTGFHSATGNRGRIWEGGFPAFEVRVHYWFDFHFAIQFGYLSASHFYTDTQGRIIDVSLARFGADLKYYFNMQNVAAPIAFANPYLLVGAGSYKKTESSALSTTTDTDNPFGMNLGGGLEFVVSNKRVYFVVEGKFHWVNYADRSSTEFASAQGVDDLTGAFTSFTGHLLFTW